MSAAHKPWWDWLLEFLAGAMTKQQLGPLPPGTPAATWQTPIAATGYDRTIEEDRQRAAVVAYMRSQVGDRYTYGAEILPGHEAEAETGDCSEYVEAAYRVAGLMIPDGVVNQRAYCRPVRAECARPGDLYILGPNAKGIPHVLVYSGQGTVIHALGGKGVVEQPADQWLTHPRFEGVRRHPDWMRPPEDRA